MGINNKVQLIGNVGQAPIAREGATAPFVTFSICTKEKSRGETADVWHNCIAFKSTAEYISKYIQKGDMVVAEGSVSYNTKGEVKYTSFIMHSVMKLKSAGGGGDRDRATKAEGRPTFEEFERRQQEPSSRGETYAGNTNDSNFGDSNPTVDDVPF
jgi:single-strand DNA-binding protein